eukprot:198552_1
MGCCVSGLQMDEASRLNTSINSDLSVALRRETIVEKLLLLGAGGSGKSTFFKQLRCIHGDGFNDSDRRPFKKHIAHQIIQEMKRMIRLAEEMFDDDPEQYKQFKLSDDVTEQRDRLLQIRDDAPLTEKLGKSIEMLWDEQAIRHIFDERAQFAITDSTEFFFNEIRRISKKGYVPTYEDVILCRHRSIGITDKLFMIMGTQMRIFDVGGQKAERRKWIHCFEHVSAVIYVASLNGYNEFMYEDESQNVMHDSLSLFERTCNNEWFSNTSLILFLNKSDLFVDKIKTVPLTCCFPDYDGPDTHDGALGEIKKQFKAKNHQRERQIYTHVTCAVDDENVKDVFNDVQHIVVVANMMEHNLALN